MVSSLKGLEVGHLVQPSVDPAVVSASLAQFDIQRFCSLFVDDVAKPIRLILSYVEKQLKLLADSVKAVRSEILSKKPVASTISSEKEQLLRRLRTLYSLIQLFSPSPPASASGIVAIGMPDSSNEDLLSTSPPLSDSSTSSSSTRVNCPIRFRQHPPAPVRTLSLRMPSSRPLPPSPPTPPSRSMTVSSPNASPGHPSGPTRDISGTSSPKPSRSSSSLRVVNPKNSKFSVFFRGLSGSTPISDLPKQAEKKQGREVHIIKELSARGGSGCTVYSVTVEGWLAALKKIDLNFLTPSFKSEIKILESLPMHEHVVRYLGHDYTDSECRLFMELWDCTLGQILTERRNTDLYFEPPEILRVSLHVAEGLRFLHQNRIIHRDLKADNIFVRRHKSVLQWAAIGDFDTAKDTFESQAKTTVGSPSIIAPEVLAGKSQVAYTDKCDVFSFGILLYEFVTLKLPWAGIPMLQTANLILSGAVPVTPPELPKQYEPFQGLWLACLKFEPQDRPSIEQIITFLTKLESLLESQSP